MKVVGTLATHACKKRSGCSTGSPFRDKAERSNDVGESKVLSTTKTRYSAGAGFATLHSLSEPIPANKHDFLINDEKTGTTAKEVKEDRRSEFSASNPGQRCLR